MPLTAADTEGRPIFPFAGGVNRARCRDPHCGAAMAAVHAVGEGPEPERVAHWRHITTTTTCPTVRRDRDRTTEWHRRWQAETGDAARVEVRIERDGKHRVADVITPFGWAVEFQHSGIGRGIYQARTDHYRGRVIWVFDYATDHLAPDLSTEGAAVVFRDRRTANSRREFRDGLIGLDDGTGVWLLPVDMRGVRAAGGGNLSVAKSLCAYWPRERFAARWINGEQMPLEEPVRTAWEEDRRAKAAAVAARPSRSGPQPSRTRPLAAGDWHCDYGGDRGRLIRDPSAPDRPEPDGDGPEPVVPDLAELVAAMDLGSGIPVRGDDGRLLHLLTPWCHCSPGCIRLDGDPHHRAAAS